MTPDRIIAIIRNVIAHRYPFHDTPDIDADTEINTICDSLDRVCIAMEIGDELNTELPEHIAAKWCRVGDIGESLSKYIGETV